MWNDELSFEGEKLETKTRQKRNYDQAHSCSCSGWLALLLKKKVKIG